jgi:hypothetical protein
MGMRMDYRKEDGDVKGLHLQRMWMMMMRRREVRDENVLEEERMGRRAAYI